MMLKVVGEVVGTILPRLPSSTVCQRHAVHRICRRKVCSRSGPQFGLFFDIDGVISRGRTLLPTSKDAFKLLTNDDGKFSVPTIFVTNAGNTLRSSKASTLSNWLDVEVTESQVVMSHSPLRMFKHFHDRHVLVCGQGPTLEIAKHLGFSKVTTIETFRHCFPGLDMVDHKRRKTAPCGFEEYFPRIEAVVLFGEPVRWETYLQLIIDVLLTNGLPADAPKEFPYPHIPVLACNMDLMWMAESPMPRFAHGAFLQCLESLYQKISGHELQYTALMGKPSEITYHHAEHVLQTEARNMGLPGIKRMYCIGDNPDVDIYGANLYDRYLHTRKNAQITHSQDVHSIPQSRTMQGNPGEPLMAAEAIVDDVEDSQVVNSSATYLNGAGDDFIGTEECKSVLVCTGVYNEQRDKVHRKSLLLNHAHRDFVIDQNLKQPYLLAEHVLSAVKMIFEREEKLS